MAALMERKTLQNELVLWLKQVLRGAVGGYQSSFDIIRRPTPPPTTIN